MYFETVFMHQNMVLSANDIASCVFFRLEKTMI